MVGISLNNHKHAEDKETLLQIKGAIIIPIKGEQDEELTFDAEDISREQSSLLFRCVAVLFVIGCLTLAIWFSLEFIGQKHHKWRSTGHSRGESMVKDLNDRTFFHRSGLIPFNHPKKAVVSTSIALNRVQGQKVITDPMNAEETPPMGLTNSARVIKNINYNITIIYDYDMFRCYIIPFAFQRVQKPSNIHDKFLNALFGPLMYNIDVLPKTAKLRMPALTENELAQYGPEVISTCPIEIQTFLVV